jgi:hypothetical protein
MRPAPSDQEVREAMSSTTDYRAAAARGDVSRYDDRAAGAGWVVFACCMLALAGTWNLIDGILAIGNSHVYGVANTYTFSDLKTWGWIMVCVGALQLIAAFAVTTGSEIARWFGIAVAGLNAIAQLGFVPSYPFWAISIFAIDVLVIYGLAAYGGARLRDL